MNAIERIELAIRRAAAQMPSGQARAFRLVADELQNLKDLPTLDAVQKCEAALEDYRTKSREADAT